MAKIDKTSGNEVEKTSIYTILELWSTIVAACSFLCIGLLRAYTSPAIASMKQDPYLFNSTSIPSKDIISWVAASPPLASFFGTLLSGPLLHYLGRRGTLTLLTFPYTVGWLMIGFAGTSIPLIMLGRVLTGLAAGLSTASAQLYVSECVRPTVRGTLGFLPAMMLSLGVLVGFAAGTINVDWRQLAFIMTCFPVVLFLMTFTLPESPAWLLLKGKEDQGFISLKRLRGGTKENMEAVEMEFKDMKTGILMKEERIPVLQLLRQRAIWYPAGVATFLMFFQMFTGANAVIYYLSVILTEAEPRNITSSSSFMAATTTLSHDLSSVVVGVVQFLAFFVSLPLIDRVGRRILLVSSAIAMAIPLGILGSYYYCNQSDSGPKCVNMIESTGSWLPLACLSVFIAAYSIGFNSIPFILMSELFPSSARSYLCSLTSFVNHFCLFLLIKGFPLALDTVGPHWTFWGFCAVCIVSVPFVLITVPETKGKSLAEIERGFAKHS